MSKVGAAGSEAKFESDSPIEQTPEAIQKPKYKSREAEIAASMVTAGFVPYKQQYEVKNPEPSDLTK